MKKLILLIIFCNIAFFANAQSNTQDEGVIINGVKWATRNVDMPGTFADTPESPGMFYQWNNKKAWSTTDSVDTGWNYKVSKGKEWKKTNDPSPTGWRVPTVDEIRKLLDKEKVENEWITTENGVTGRKFTDKATGNTLFLPAVGGRYGSYLRRSISGKYWSSTPCKLGTLGMCDFGFDEDGVYRHSFNRSYGLSVRSIAE